MHIKYSMLLNKVEYSSAFVEIAEFDQNQMCAEAELVWFQSSSVWKGM